MRLCDIMDVMPVASNQLCGNISVLLNIMPRPSPTYAGVVGSECNTSEVMETEPLFYC